MLDIKGVQKEAEEELRKEAEADAKRRIKQKMKDLQAAKVVVANLQRELEDLYVAISDGN